MGGGFGPARVGRERIEITLNHPITTDRIGLLQANKGARGRWVTRVGLRFDGGPTLHRDLSLDSRRGQGQEFSFPSRTFSKVDITIEDTVANKVGKVATEKARRRFTGVGFAEVTLRDQGDAKPARAVEIERMPTDLLHTLGARSASHPLAIIMTPTFADFRRRFELPTGRAFALEGDGRLNANARDDAIDAALGIAGLVDGGIRVSSSERYGSAAARGSQAFDGDPTTAWTSRARDIVGQSVTVEVPAPVTVDHFDLQFLEDGRHSIPTRLRISTRDGTSQAFDIPPGTPVDGLRSVTVRFPALTSDRFRVVLDGIQPVRVQGSDGAPIVLPVGIAELGIEGVRRAPLPETMPESCIERQLTIDGQPIGVRVSGRTADAVRGRALPIEPCTPNASVELAAGSHLVRGRTTRTDGVSFGRMVLTSDAEGNAASVDRFAPSTNPTPPPAVKVLDSGRTSMKVRVDGGAGNWLVLGQSLNPGWHASIDGQDLGAPQLVDGFANGWRIPARFGSGPVTVHLEWQPQRVVAIGLWISGLAALACLLVIACSWSRRRPRVTAGHPSRDDDDDHDDDGGADVDEPSIARGVRSTGQLVNVFALGGGPPSWSTTVIATMGAAVMTALIVRPWLGIVVGVLAFGALRLPRVRGVVRLLPAALMLAIGAYVASGQLRHNYPPRFLWPNSFEAVRNLSWLVVILLAVEVVIGRLVRPAGSTPSAES